MSFGGWLPKTGESGTGAMGGKEGLNAEPFAGGGGGKKLSLGKGIC